MKTLELKDIAWVAGLLEGEGCFYVSPDSRTLNIYMRSTDRDVVERLKAITGGTRNITAYGPSVSRPSSHNKKVMFCYDIPNQLGFGWMLTIFSFMGSRRRLQILDCVQRWKHGIEIERVGRGKRRNANLPLAAHWIENRASKFDFEGHK